MCKQFLQDYRLTSRILNRVSSSVIMVFFLLVSCNVLDAAAQAKGDVKLVLQVTVDGLRGDLLSRYGNRFTEGGGFRYLMKEGTPTRIISMPTPRPLWGTPYWPQVHFRLITA